MDRQTSFQYSWCLSRVCLSFIFLSFVLLASLPDYSSPLLLFLSVSSPILHLYFLVMVMVCFVFCAAERKWLQTELQRWFNPFPSFLTFIFQLLLFSLVSASLPHFFLVFFYPLIILFWYLLFFSLFFCLSLFLFLPPSPSLAHFLIRLPPHLFLNFTVFFIPLSLLILLSSGEVTFGTFFHSPSPCSFLSVSTSRWRTSGIK